MRRFGWVCLAVLILATPRSGHAQQAEKPLPKFEDYPVKEIFAGAPHPPVLVTREQRLYRTRIREGVEKGWGVWVNGETGREQNQPGPNFAGHYIVIFWGCGAACIRMAMSDAETGAVFGPPVTEGQFALAPLMFPDSAGGSAIVEYRLDSSLMILKTTPHPDRRGSIPYAFYFVWQRDHWALLRRLPLEQ
jgi:hypothetical protein